MLVCLAAGCSGEVGEPWPVRGKVSYRGTPLRGGTVVFTPDPSRGGSGPLARAEIQGDGSYALQTDDRPGTAAGWYRVTVVAVEASGTASRRGLLPGKYSDPELSGLSYQVKAGQENTIDLHLE